MTTFQKHDTLFGSKCDRCELLGLSMCDAPIFETDFAHLFDVLEGWV